MRNEGRRPVDKAAGDQATWRPLVRPSGCRYRQMPYPYSYGWSAALIDLAWPAEPARRSAVDTAKYCICTPTVGRGVGSRAEPSELFDLRYRQIPYPYSYSTFAALRTLTAVCRFSTKRGGPDRLFADVQTFWTAFRMDEKLKGSSARPQKQVISEPTTTPTTSRLIKQNEYVREQ